MITYLKLSKKPKQFLSFTGVTLQQFDTIVINVKKQYSVTEKARLSKRKRLHKIRAGHKFDLSVQDKLVMLLVYYRLYITCELAGYLFNLDQSNVNRNIRYLEPAVKQSIPIPTKLYADSKKINDVT